MPIRYAHRYTREEIRANPGTLYVFGDNMQRVGRGGQARECRGEPNTIGVPTKWRPVMSGGFFSDGDFDAVKPAIQEAFREMACQVSNGGVVVWPSDGVGTGLADLPTRYPMIYAFIQRCLAHLGRVAGDNSGI